MHLLRLTLAFSLATSAIAQSSPSDIRAYIHQSFDTLTRSTADCASIADSKLTTAPILYLPSDEKMSPAIRSLQQNCKVDVRRLPRPIRHEGDLLPDQLTAQGLLYLPNPYVVPGGRFNEMYGWDSYFILLGEIADNRVELARGTVENFFYEIDNYGGVLNANRTYYLTRSQPPFLSSMVLAVYEALLKQDPKAARSFLHKSVSYLIRTHDLWISPSHLAGDTKLSRYFDLGQGPVPEMADDSTYYVDVIHYLLAHPTPLNDVYLTKATGSSSCVSNCLQTSANGYQLTPSFFAGDRAMRESGFDTSFRFGPFSGSTEDFAPFCLNALLYKYERDLAFIFATLDDKDSALQWSEIAGSRLAKINELQWDNELGLFVDYDYVTKQRFSYPYLTTYYALWSGIATPAQAQRLHTNLKLFEGPGGLAMSTSHTGMQWDAPYGWAPTNWLAVAGLERYKFHDDALRISREFTTTVASNYAHDGTIREKYNVESADANVQVSAGYKANVIGFGWTNAVYLKMQQLLTQPQP